MDSNLVKALVTAGVWLVVILVVRFVLERLYRRYERGLVERDPAVAARRRTTFSVLLRVVVAIVILIGTWSVLSIFPVTEEVARAFLASSAVLALIAGLALSTPLGNVGSGVLLAFTQPMRLGDRITVAEHTGVVAEITLSYTALVTDEGRRVYVPNQKMVSTVLVNRSIGDPRRTIAVRLPVRLGAPVTEARRIASGAVARVGADLEIEVQVGDVSEKVVWLDVAGFAPPRADVTQIAGEVREQALAALAEADLLPA